MTGYRLPNRPVLNSIVDHNTTQRFTFDGIKLVGLAGDTLASALVANGQSLFGRSFKYHRPRGLFSAGSEEPNALVTVGEDAYREPNQRATMVELHDGLIASSQNCWPSLKHDIGSINGYAGGLIGAGFYYKTFMGPSNDAWMLYEYFIRRAAGMGRGSFEADPDHYEHVSAYPDILVIGSGPAGLSAAIQASRAGASVMLCEEQPYFGGSLLGDFSSFNAVSAPEWIKAQVDDLAASDRVTLLPRTTLYGAFDDMTFAAVERLSNLDHAPKAGTARQRHWTIRAKQVIVATGRVDRPIVFPGNDKPGVMLLDGVRTLALKYGVAAGKAICIFANNDSAYGAVADLSKAGVSISHVIDARPNVSLEKAELVRLSGAELITGSVVCGTNGHKRVKSVKVAKWDNRKLASASFGIACDCLAVSGGTTPLVHLGSQNGMQPVWNDEAVAFTMPFPLPAGWHGAGAANSEFSLKDAVASGNKAGANAAKAIGLSPKRITPVSVGNLDFSMTPSNILPIWEVPKSVEGSKQKAFVDLQHDVTADDIKLAKLEGYSASEHLKRYTTLSMASDQGKTSNVNGMAIMADALGIPIDQVGTTRFRPPFAPVALGAIAGEPVRDHLMPLRKTPMHQWHLNHGAEMMNVGLWQRPRVYYRGQETLEEAYIREARAVRQSVGICDVSTLGKIDVQGPDAAEFLNRLYSNGFAKLPVGKARYGLMLRRDGLLYDDGTSWRLSETQFLTTTTTANAAAVMAEMEYYLAAWWPDLKVRVASVTDQWASAAVSGPNARKVLAKVTSDDISNEALGFMGVKTIIIDQVECLIARLSFSGELAYEVYWPASEGDNIWCTLMKAGEAFDITPYGLEALGTLRVEKGHIAGSEMDGRVTADDVGLAAMCSSKKDYIGKALMHRPALLEDDRLQMVGLVAEGPFALTAGAHLVTNDTMSEPAKSEGHVTAPTYSPALEKHIALGLLRRGRARHGETIYVSDPMSGTHYKTTVVDPVFYDPSGEKMHG